MTLLGGVARLANRVFSVKVAHAHCDIPCGIYDPHMAQIAALTTVRMNQLIEGLTVPALDASSEERNAYASSMVRYVSTKEQHAELCKAEIRVLWGDYFGPEHVEQHPDLHQQVFQVMKLGSRVRQNNDMQAAQDLLTAVQGIAEVFWATKGASTTRQPSRQWAAGGELVYPA
jgi:nickel superoxide dismutase